MNQGLPHVNVYETLDMLLLDTIFNLSFRNHISKYQGKFIIFKYLVMS